MRREGEVGSRIDCESKKKGRREVDSVTCVRSTLGSCSF